MKQISNDKAEKLLKRIDKALHEIKYDENASILEVLEEYGDILQEIIKELRG